MKNHLRGFTLLELMIAFLLVALVMAVAVPSFRSLFRVELRGTANQMAGLVRETYNKAALNSKTYRVIFDLDKAEYWTEVSSDIILLSDGDSGFEGGKIGLFGEDNDKFKYAKPPEFVLEDEENFEKESLPSGVHFVGFWADNLEERVRQGQHALYFFPGGQTQKAQISLGEGDDAAGENTLTVVTKPLTGEVVVEHGEPEIKSE